MRVHLAYAPQYSTLKHISRAWHEHVGRLGKTFISLLGGGKVSLADTLSVTRSVTTVIALLEAY